MRRLPLSHDHGLLEGYLDACLAYQLARLRPLA